MMGRGKRMGGERKGDDSVLLDIIGLSLHASKGLLSCNPGFLFH